MTNISSTPVAPDAPEKVPLGMRLATVAAVTLPPVGFLAAAVLLWPWGFSWLHLGLLLGMYVLTGLGITVGFHRLFTHRSFETYTWVKFVLAAIGSMAAQGPILRWAALHRRHHQFSDTPDDPHTPHHRGHGLVGLVRGFWHAHVGWVFDPALADLDRYVTDLKQVPAVRLASDLAPLWILLGLAIPAALGGLITLSWGGALLGFLWGGAARLFLVHHLTWSINSVCHIWGSRPYPDRDQSRNNVVFGILGFGEGWHNNHHAFPTSARHGLRWWQIDVSYYAIRLMALVGLAWKVRVPATATVMATAERPSVVVQ